MKAKVRDQKMFATVVWVLIAANVIVTLAGVRFVLSLRGAPEVTIGPPAWLPSGFRAVGDELGVRWLDDDQFTCTYSLGNCWGLEVVARDGCQDLYAEITILDSSGANIGWTNDNASGVRPLERTRLIFDTFEDRAHFARLAQLNCH